MAGPISEHGQGQGGLRPTSAKTIVPKKTVLPPSKKTQYYTTKAQAAAALTGPSDEPGYGVRFQTGRGYYLGAGSPASGGGATLPPPAGHRSYTAAQEATMHVNQLLAPQYTQAARDAQIQNQAIKGFTQAIIAQLQGEPQQLANIYNPQIEQQGQMANAAADSLRAVNPTGDVSKLLDAVGAPQSQQQQIAGNLNNTFNGGAAVGQYVNGVLPLGALRSQSTAAQALAALQPGFEALRGQQGLQSALAQQADTRSKIAQQAPQLTQQWLSDFQSNKAKQQQLALEQRATHTFDSTKSRALGYQVDSQGLPIRDTAGKLQVLPGFKQLPNGSVVKAYVPKAPSIAKIDSTVSSHSGRGIALDSRGKPVLINGKTIPWNATTKSSLDKIDSSVSTHAGRGIALDGQGKPVLINGKTIPWNGATAKGSQAAAFPNLTKTQIQHLRSGVANAFYGFTDKNNTVHPPLGYQDAITEAVKAGYSRAAATRMANRFFMPGVRGRPISNKQQVAQYKARRPKTNKPPLGPPTP